MTQTSAGVVCRQLGYSAGVVSTSPCSAYGGSNVCGSAGSSVAMKNVKCNGGEASIQECPWADPDAECASHLSDSVVFCTNHKPDEAVSEGTLRLLGATGAPSLDGVGRLEIYQGSEWGPVCSDGWATGSEAVRGVCSSYFDNPEDPCVRLLAVRWATAVWRVPWLERAAPTSTA